MTQQDQILTHLKEHGSISIWESITRYRITRLSARIHEIRTLPELLSQGLEIKSEPRSKGGKSWTEYMLISSKNSRERTILK